MSSETVMNGNVKNLDDLKLLLFCNAGIHAGLCLRASERHGLCSHPSGAVRSQPESPIHCLSSPGLQLAPKV